MMHENGLTQGCRGAASGSIDGEHRATYCSDGTPTNSETITTTAQNMLMDSHNTAVWARGSDFDAKGCGVQNARNRSTLFYRYSNIGSMEWRYATGAKIAAADSWRRRAERNREGNVIPSYDPAIGARSKSGTKSGFRELETSNMLEKGAGREFAKRAKRDDKKCSKNVLQ